MKNQQLFLLTLVFMPFCMFAQWQIQDPGFTEPKEIKHLHAVNESVVWITAHAGYGQQILSQVFSKTTDGGTTWTPGIITTEELSTSMIFALSDQVAFVPMYRSGVWTGQPGLFKTSDGGVTWTRQAGVYTDPTSFPDIVHFFDNNNGMTLGDPVDGYFEIYVTSNGGASWTRVSGEDIPNPLTNEYATVDNYAFYANSIWVPTTKGRVLRSTDLGATWTLSVSPYPGAIYTAFYGENQGVIMDHQSWDFTSLNETSDGGVTWSPVPSTGPVLNWDITYVPGTVSTLVSTGVVVTNGLAFSINGGHDWHYAPQSEGINFFHSGWLNNTTGWAGGFNDETGRAVIYKYAGPGLTGLTLSTNQLIFENIHPEETAIATLVIDNYSENEINILSLFTDTPEFWPSVASAAIAPGSNLVLDVFFTPSIAGNYTGTLFIETDFPDLTNITIDLAGVCVTPGTEFIFDPESFNETMIPGENKIKNLSFTNTSENAYVWEIETEYLAPLQSLGWQYGSTPLDADDGILGESPDQAMFIKDIHIRSAFDQAILRLGFDDGIRVWVNGTLVLDDKYATHLVGYWNQEFDITEWLDQGVNRITVVVFNGVFEGGEGGGFDCELEIDGQQLIKRGDLNYGQPEAMWFYYGNVNELLVPPNDVNEKDWWEKEYGSYHWLSLNKSVGMASVDGFESMGWNYWSAPFGGNEFLLNESPDNAYFIKDFEIETHDEAILYLNYDDGCMVILNGGLLFDFSEENHSGEYWNKELNISENLIEGRNRLSILVLNGVIGGGGTGSFDCHLLVDGINKISRGDFYNGEPEAFWHVYGQAGQVLTPPNDASGRLWWEMDYALNLSPLPALGWIYNSTPVFENPNLLSASPDNAQFIKDIEIGEFIEAFLYLGYDDGCRVWINGVLEFDFHNEVHNLNYWDRELDLSGILTIGTNRIAIEVYNGIYGGGAFGGFDCQLLVDGVEIIKRGDENPGEAEALWFMFGEAGKVLIPPNDANGLDWFQKEYGLAATSPSHFLQGNLAGGQTDQVKVVFDATGLAPGDYSAIIRFNNAGTQENFEIPVNLQMVHVMDETCMEVTPTSLNFGEYFIGHPETLKLKIQNLGYNTLFVDGINALHQGITITPNTFSIEPGKSSDIEVTIELYDVMAFNSSLVIISNDDGQTEVFVPISADCKNAPSLVIENLEYMYSYLASGQSETQNLHIDNWGGSPLIFTIPQAQVKDGKAGSVKKPIQPVKLSQPQVPAEVKRDKAPSYYQTDIIGHKNLVVNDVNQKAADAPKITIFSDDMENGTENWTIENLGEGRSQWHQVKTNSYSPETSWWCGSETTGNYVNDYTVREAIITTEIKLPNVESVIILEFNESFEMEDGFDQGYVDISLDGGNEWIRIREGIPGSSDGWVTTVLDISEFYGNTIKIRFFFDTGDNIANDYPGWFIDDVRVYVEGFNFLSLSPGEGIVNAGESFDISVNFDATGYNNGYYPGFIMLQTNDPQNQQFYLPAILEVWGENYVQFFDMPAGWSGISSYLVPENSALEQIFSPISEELIILQNLTSVYWPQESLNTIGDWNYLDGYTIKLNNAATLEFTGTIPENRLIEMQAGWSLIPVLSFNPVPATDFDPLESLNIIKEVAGTGVYWPAYNINTLQELQPGKSYLINVSGDEVFEYPPMVAKSGVFGNLINEQLISPWNEVTRTAATHVVALPAESMVTLKVGDVIGIFNHENYCAGFVTINNLSQSQPIAVFGDDPTTSTNEGLLPGEKMEFRLWRSSTNETLPLEVSFDKLLPNQEYFAVEGLSAISELKTGEILPGNLSSGEISVYPNPAGDFIKILSTSPISCIEISDAKGQVFLTSHPDNLTDPEVDLSKIQTGMYYVKIITTGNTAIRKVIKL